MITVSEKYRDIKSFSKFEILKEHGLGLLKETVEAFFNCKVSFLFEPIRQAKKNFDIDLLDNPKRGCYPIDDDCFFLYIRVLESNVLISGLGMVLNGKDIKSHKNFINHFEGALTKKLSSSYKKWFEDCSLIFGDNLLLHAICNYSARGIFDYRRFYHLVSLFHKLRTTTFESESVSTGLILTKSHYSYNGKNEEGREGTLYQLLDRKQLKSTFRVEKRFWYLADGKQCFFVADRNIEIGNLFVLNSSYKKLGYIDSNCLSLTLKGGDILFRTEGDGSLSIINSENTEFLYVENQWRMRDYDLIKKYMLRTIPDIEVVNRLLFFILYCSKNSISSVIWIPSNLDIIKKFVKPETLNSLIAMPISVLDNKFTNHIFRCMSSDGATIISEKGDMLHFGCIVDISLLNIEGVKGTGESAAKILSKNGMAIKISQDGAIKMYLPGAIDSILV